MLTPPQKVCHDLTPNAGHEVGEAKTQVICPGCPLLSSDPAGFPESKVWTAAGQEGWSGAGDRKRSGLFRKGQSI